MRQPTACRAISSERSIGAVRLPPLPGGIPTVSGGESPSRLGTRSSASVSGLLTLDDYEASRANLGSAPDSALSEAVTAAAVAAASSFKKSPPADAPRTEASLPPGSPETGSPDARTLATLQTGSGEGSAAAMPGSAGVPSPAQLGTTADGGTPSPSPAEAGAGAAAAAPAGSRQRAELLRGSARPGTMSAAAAAAAGVGAPAAGPSGSRPASRETSGGSGMGGPGAPTRRLTPPQPINVGGDDVPGPGPGPGGAAAHAASSTAAAPPPARWSAAGTGNGVAAKVVAADSFASLEAGAGGRGDIAAAASDAEGSEAAAGAAGAAGSAAAAAALQAMVLNPSASDDMELDAMGMDPGFIKCTEEVSDGIGGGGVWVVLGRRSWRALRCRARHRSWVGRR